MNVKHVNTRKLAVSKQPVAHGFTLVELMVAMLLGLIVIAGVSSVFLANLRSYKTNTALGDVQSNARIAFELMARDIRQAGLTGCNSTSGRVANVLNNGPYGASAHDWWADLKANAIRGYDDTQTDASITGGMPARAASTDALTLIGAGDAVVTVESADDASHTYTLRDPHPTLQTGDVAIICNFNHAALMQVTAYNSTTKTLTHGANASAAPGNCSYGLGFPTICGSGGATALHTFGPGASISTLAAHDWYIGANPVGGRSLYRVGLTLDGGEPKPTAQEMVRNLTDMQITYHVHGDANFVDADAVTNWNAVDAVHITFTLQSADQRAGTDAKPLTRTLASTTSIRNRT